MKKTSRNILIILVLFISIAGAILPRKLNDLDEIWNYNFARCIADGLLPYKNFNIITTPLLPIICGGILKITFNELIVMRMLAIFLITALLFVTYKIFEKLTVHIYMINIFLICIYILLYKYFCIDYNYAVLLITLITIYFELKSEIFEAKYKKDFWLGILVGTSILFKQTTGIALTIVFIFYKLLLVSNNEELKKTFKIILYRIIGTLLPVIVFVLYLVINNIWNDFLDYAIYSINTFSNKKSYIYLIKGNYGITIQILSVIVPLTILIMYYLSIVKKQKTEQQKNIFVLFCYSIASIVVVYPISDSIHFLIGSIPCIISMFYLLYICLNKVISKFNNKIKLWLKYFVQMIGIFSILMIFSLSSYIIIKYIRNANEYKDLNHFKYIPSSSENIKKIDNYIAEKNAEGKQVYIIDATAALYMIPLDKYNKDYDLFLKGNIGAKGEEGQIEKLKNENKNTLLLMLNDNYRKNWQTPDKVIKYIKENWKKIETINQFDVYERKL